MSHADTITALATPPGRAARTILRIAGPAVPEILTSLLTTPPTTRGTSTTTLHLPPSPQGGEGRGEGLPKRSASPSPTPPRTSPQRKQGTSSPSASPPSPPIAHCPLPIACLHFPVPNSYTTDHTAELLFPANPHLARRLLETVLSFDTVRLAHPGEFTQRAYAAGQLTLDQAEGVAALIAADRDDELAEARDLLAGTTGDRYRAWAHDLATLLALVEAGIDFTDQEDVVPIAPADLKSKLASLRTTIDAHAADPAEARTEAPTVALVGPPSAGKSTLFNALLGRDRAVTDAAPGTTRDVLAEPLSLDGAGEVTLFDLPGLDLSAATDIDRAAQSAAIDAAARADLLIHCDPAGVFTPDPRLPERPTLRVRTKADLLHERSSDLEVCALDGYHLDTLRRAIADQAFAHRSSAVPRHARALAAAAQALADAIETIDPDDRAVAEPELTANAMRTALDELGQITGDITPDDVIGRVFAAFCVGK